jgi:hypothetical protein
MSTTKWVSHPYLQDKTITISHVSGEDNWRQFYDKAIKDVESRSQAIEVLNRIKSQPFAYPNANEKRFCVPLAAQGVKPTLDNQIKNACPDFGGMELTQEEYFSKVLNANLNPYIQKENWWCDNNNKAAYITILDGYLKLNLRTPIDMLQYLVLTTHYSDIVATSMAEYKTKRLQTYLYIINDASVTAKEDVTAGEDLMEAAIIAKELSADATKMRRFFATLGRNFSATDSVENMRGPLLAMMSANPTEFIKAYKDPNASIKFILMQARQNGIVTYNLQKDTYKLPSGFSGDLKTVVEYLVNVKNQDEFFDIKEQVETKTK